MKTSASVSNEVSQTLVTSFLANKWWNTGKNVFVSPLLKNTDEKEKIIKNKKKAYWKAFCVIRKRKKASSIYFLRRNGILSNKQYARKHKQNYTVCQYIRYYI